MCSKRTNRKTIMLTLALSAITTHNSSAYERGDWIVRTGYAAVDPVESSSDLKLNGMSLNGTGVGADGASALGLSVSYMIGSNFGVEILAATPFKHALTSKGLAEFGLSDGTRLGNTKQLPPTISAQYYFARPDSRWQPYVGLGLNYTTFFDENLSTAAKNRLGASNLHLQDSWGLAAEFGLDWKIDENWLLNAAIWRMDIDTNASLDTALGRAKIHVDIDPWVYLFGIGRRF